MRNRRRQRLLAISETSQSSAAVRFQERWKIASHLRLGSSCNFRAQNPLFLREFWRFGLVNAQITNTFRDSPILFAKLQINMQSIVCVALEQGDYKAAKQRYGHLTRFLLLRLQSSPKKPGRLGGQQIQKKGLRVHRFLQKLS